MTKDLYTATSTPERDSILPNHEKKGGKHRVGKFIARLAMAATCVIPPADLALSDAAFVKSYEIIQEKIDLPSKPIERSLELGLMGSVIMGESLALGQVLTRNKKLQNTFTDFDTYSEEKRQQMKGVRKAVSVAANTPFMVLEKIGNAFEFVGDKISERKSKVARAAGHLLVDAGQVNALGTSTVIMEETMAGKTPSFARQAYLSGLITGSWLFAAEGVRSLYRNVEAIRPPMAAIGRTYEALTTINLHNPLETPIGTSAIGLTAVALAYTGWKIEEFRQQREQLSTISHADVINS